jgi:hypothetical protein
MNPNDLLLKAVQARQGKSTPFNGGILTADRYVKTISECIGSNLCYRFAATKATSFGDLMVKAAKTLTYNNPDMAVEECYGKKYNWVERDHDGDERQFELPAKTLMAFRHVLTTPRKDRDGDIMRTQGAKIDPKMPLLWQHVHTLPIGKMVRVHEHDSNKLVLVSAIIDINELCHDSAVMIEAGMGRFSHGFRALEFSKIGGVEAGEEDGGFDVKLFEVMEESLVSVPSNTDAETQEVLLSLAEGGKLKSPIMKEVGAALRVKRPKSVAVGADVAALRVPVTLDVSVNFNGKAIEHGQKKCTGEAGCGCGCAPEKADEHSDKKDEAANKEMMVCPKCGDKMIDGQCKCGYAMGKATEPDFTKLSPEMTTVLVNKSMQMIMLHATTEQRTKFRALLDVLDQVEQQAQEDEKLLAFVG